MVAALGYQDGPPSPLQFPGPGPGDAPETLARRIDAAVAAIAPEHRGRLILSLTQQRAALDVMVKLGGPASVLARIAKPRVGPLEGEVLFNVNFAGEVLGGHQALRFADCYHALRGEYAGVKRNGRLRAFVKALAMDKLGKRPYLDGRSWFE